jgi:hypothetical protein
MSPIAPHNFVALRGAHVGYRPPYDAGNHRGSNHRDHYHRRYPAFCYGAYPYTYVNSWELLSWNLGYPDFTGYGDENGAEPSRAQAQPAYEEPQQPPQEDRGYRPEYTPAPNQSRANHAAASMPAHDEPQLTLIFKDGHTQAIQNYVLTPRDVIVMDDAASGRVPRIALSDLNLPATEQAAREDGLDFSPPAT